MLNRPVGRRAFLQGSTLLLTAGVLQGPAGFLKAAEGSPEILRIGLITDLHYADKPTAGSRHYRETLAKLTEATDCFSREQVAFVMELGDLIDSAPDLETELGYVRQVNRQFASQAKNRHYVLGNHCVERLTKEEFLTEVGQPESYYSFDQNGFHFVVLDACFRPDGVPYGRKNSKWTEALIPPQEVDWLKQDLKATELPVIVFAHQRLDVNTHYAPRNVAEVRDVLESSRKVRAVFQGHSHANDYREINGIHYCTLVAMIEGSAPEQNGYSVLSIDAGGNLRLAGFRQQKSRDWTQATK